MAKKKSGSSFFDSLTSKLEAEDIDNVTGVKSFIDTGCLALNQCLSGDLYGGVPEARITTFYGISGCSPAGTTVLVAARNVDGMSDIKPFLGNDDFAESMKSVPTGTKVKWLRDIGYTVIDISRELRVSRQMIHRILVKGDVQPIRRDSSVNKISCWFERHLYICPIELLGKLMDKNKKGWVLVYAPNDFTKIKQFFVKPERMNTYEVTLANGQKTRVSANHLFRVEPSPATGGNEWMQCESILMAIRQGDAVEILTYGGKSAVKSIDSMSIDTCYDIQVEREDECYYLDGIASHNSGKSLITGQIIVNALSRKENPLDGAIYIDTEGGIVKNVFASIDECYREKIKVIRCGVIEECTVLLNKIFRGMIQNNKDRAAKNLPPERFIVVLDSFGGLVPQYVIDNATEKDKQVADQGRSASIKNTMMKSLMLPVVESGSTLLVVNHAYDDPSAMGHAKFLKMPGGKGLEFASESIVFCTVTKNRDEDGGIKEGKSYYSSMTFHFTTFKNRVVPQGFQADMVASFKDGILPFDGLWDQARENDFIVEQGRGRYCVPSYDEKKTFTQKQLLANTEESHKVWGSFLVALNESQKKRFEYVQAHQAKDAMAEADAELAKMSDTEGEADE